jgi:lipoprotein NlpD
MRRRPVHAWWPVILLLAGCATSQQAPVTDRTPQTRKATPAKPATAAAKRPASAEKDWRPDNYIVKKGDTLYSIGLEHGFDYKEIAQKNNIGPPYVIRIGQILKLKDSKAAEAAPAEVIPGTVAVTTPIKTEPMTAPKQIGEPPLKTEPKATKEPYSEQAMAAPLPKPAEPPVPPAAKAEPPSAKAEPPKPVEAAKAELPKPEPAPEKPAIPAVSAPAGDDEAVDWGWPAQGKVTAGFNESNGSKGMDISGTQGQPVLAAAAGKVVYSGSGLRGYGKLVIIKHNKTYLSAYAHNSQILVKEGQEVAKGQKIAEMGSTDTDKVKLHFEIRKLGKPIDPSRHLPEKP